MDIEILSAKECDRESWIEQSRFSREVLEKVIHINDGYSFIAKYNGENIGIISLYIRDICDNNTLKEAYIDLIEVKKQYRRMRVATELLNKVIEISKDKGLYQLRAWSSLDKKEAIKLWEYEKFCFNPTIMYKSGLEIHGVYVTKLL